MKGVRHYIAEDLVLFTSNGLLAEWIATDAGDLLAKHAEFQRIHGT